MSTEDDPEYWERIREEYVSQGPRGISVFGHPGPRVEYAGFDRGDEDLLKYDDDIRKAAGEDYSMDNFSDEDLDKGETLDDGESDFIEENQWIECQEVKTGRIFFYHRDSLTLVSDLEKLEFQGPSGRIFRVIESKKGYRYDKANNYDEEDNLISEGIAKTEEQMLTQLSSWEIQADGLLRQKFLSEDIRERLEDIRLRLNQLMSVVENEQSHQDKSDVERVVDLTAQKWNMDNEEVHGYRARVSRFNHLQYRFRDFNFPQYYSISPLPETHLKSLECNITMPKEVALTMESNKLKFYIHPNDTANALIERIHDMLSDEARQSINLDLYVLKGVGLWEYFDGEDLMYHYETVRHCLRRRTTLELVLVPYPPEGIVSEASTANERDYLSKVIPDLPVLDPHDFRDIDIENSSWDTLEYFPMYQMDWPYRLKVVGIDHISALALPKLESNNVMKVYVKTFLFFGTQICKPSVLSTPEQQLCESPRWSKFLEPSEEYIPLKSLPREARVAIILYGKGLQFEEPLAFVCLPLIDQFGHLIRGRKSLRMWPISASSDDKTTASFGYIFRGPMRENCVESAHPQTLVTIEFEKFVNPVVAPVNVPYVAPNLRIVGEKIDIKKLQKRKRVRIEFLVKVDPLYELNDEDRAIIWESRHYLLAHAQALPKFLQSVDWFSSDHRHEAHRMLKEWAIPISPVSAIELLDVKYADSTVREYAVSCLRVLQDDELRLFLLQLIQTVKFELYHDSSLVRFLIERALRNPFSIGHPLFWHLKAELYQVEHCERFAVILEEYLSFAGLHTRELRKQVDAMNKFARVSGHIAGLLRAKEKSKDEVKAICQEKLTHLNNSFFNKIGSIQIPINPRWVTSSLVVEKCKFMSSKMAPLWLVFKNADPEGPDLVVIFKSGDDLRQDILTLQLLQVMDKIWLSESLDMRLTCYTCVATGWNAQGKGVGMIEAVLQSSTLSGIQKEFGGGAIGALRLEPIHRYVRNWNRRDDEFEKAVENFWRSCAGYCVSTYVMGIGDRHNGNIMVTHDGHLFHIDFGHFLGNFKQKFGINRERAAFVLTPEMAFVMGGKKYKKSKTFQKFGEISKDAFKILRKHADLFINLFVLMVSAGMPELLVSADIDYLRRMFYLEQGEKEAVGMLEKEIKKSLNTTYRQIDNMIHIWKHGG